MALLVLLWGRRLISRNTQRHTHTDTQTHRETHTCLGGQLTDISDLRVREALGVDAGGVVDCLDHVPCLWGRGGG
jgi:hypothetical protein